MVLVQSSACTLSSEDVAGTPGNCLLPTAMYSSAPPSHVTRVSSVAIWLTSVLDMVPLSSIVRAQALQ